MAYTANLGVNQQLYLENQGTQTLISLNSSNAGQQQRQSISLTTGNWTVPPTLFTTKFGFVLQLDTDKRQYFIQIQANGINTLNNAPSLNNAETVPLQEIADSAPQNSNKIEFEPMQPMNKMKMGNMSMSMNPMEMRMGNMSMKMGKKVKSTSTKRFCTQCGHPVNKSDRFCSSCGHQLKD
ncbi:zinc ribbon domain-containing protein [Stanieria cyanosphaera]|nr:zinc ribbon domain-containing protein [Stanieria cyanosphaera]